MKIRKSLVIGILFRLLSCDKCKRKTCVIGLFKNPKFGSWAAGKKFGGKIGGKITAGSKSLAS
jgi:hypothetical protein